MKIYDIYIGKYEDRVNYNNLTAQYVPELNSSENGWIW